MRPQSVTPSMFGIMTSSRITSGEANDSISKASNPSLAVQTL
jgi:hypothetical protein